MRSVLAFDLGGTRFRAALVNRDGRVAHASTVALTVGAAADPELWWQTLCRLVDDVAISAGADFDAVAAVAIAGFTRTQICLGDDDRVLRPAITWRDTQAEALLPALRQALPANHPETPAINAFHPLARLYFLSRTEPDTLAKLAAVIEPKDFLNARLTGRVTIDVVAGARLIAAAQPGPDGRSLLAAAELPETIIPPALAPTDIVGHVLPNHSGALSRLTGKPVLAMAHDTWASVIGLGALRPGFAYNLSGTTEVLGVLNEIAAPAEGLLTVDWSGGLTQIGGPSQNGADTLTWLIELLGHDGDPIGPALDALLTAPRDPQPALFLPYLQGERAPYWDPSLRGAFIGLNRRHQGADLAHAVIEGIAFLNRTVLARAEAATGRQVTEIRFGGGGAANPRWCQVKADVTRRPVVVIDEAEPGLVGAAITAFAAIDHANLADLQATMVRTRASYEPRPDHALAYDRLFTLFQSAEAALAPISRSLAAEALPCPA